MNSIVLDVCATTGDTGLNGNIADRSFSEGVFSLSTSRLGIVDYAFTNITKPSQTYAQFSIISLENGPRSFSGNVKGMNDACKPTNHVLCRANIGRNIYVRNAALTASTFNSKVFQCRSSGESLGSVTFNSDASVATSTINVLTGIFNVSLNKAPNGNYE